MNLGYISYKYSEKVRSFEKFYEVKFVLNGLIQVK